MSADPVRSASVGHDRVTPPPPPAHRPRGRFWPNLRLILITATVTSLAWIVLLGYAESDVVGAPVAPGETMPQAFSATSSGGGTGNGAGAASGGDSALVPRIAAPQQGLALAPRGSMRIPVAGVKPSALVDTFTAPRGERQHNAIDIIVPQGSAVVAAADGTVEKLFVSQDGGNTIYVRSPDGTRMYYYAHLLGYQPGLTEGTFVRAGQPIGTVGATGNANPAVPHLHFQMLRMNPGDPWWEGTPENPYPVLSRLR